MTDKNTEALYNDYIVMLLSYINRLGYLPKLLEDYPYLRVTLEAEIDKATRVKTHAPTT
jgi:hypothetical protein